MAHFCFFAKTAIRTGAKNKSTGTSVREVMKKGKKYAGKEEPPASSTRWGRTAALPATIRLRPPQPDDLCLEQKRSNDLAIYDEVTTDILVYSTKPAGFIVS